jgi:hypothetical protein
VNVIARIIGRVELDDPVDLGDIESTGGDVGTEKVAGRSVAKLEECVGSLLLLLFPLL